MILIRTPNSKQLEQYFSEAGVRSDQVIFNGPETPSTKVLVHVGGPGVDATHCYIQQHYKIPLISCLDPATVWQIPINKTYIILALQKARRIDNGELPLTVENSQVQITTEVRHLSNFLDDISDDSRIQISVDIESNVDTNELTCIGFGYGYHAVVVPLEREGQNYWSEADEAQVWRLLARILAGSNPKVFQNFIFDTMMLSKQGISVNGEIKDTMTLAHLIQPELKKGLDNLGRLYLLCDVWKGISSYASNEVLWQYNGRDALYTLQILAEQERQLAGTDRLKLWEPLLVPLHRVVLDICQRGLTVDKAALAQLTEETGREVAQLTAELQAMAEGLLPPKVEFVPRNGSLKKLRDSGRLYVMGSHTYEPFVPPPELKMGKKHTSQVYERIEDDSPFNPASPDQVKSMIQALGITVPTVKGKQTTDELALKKLMSKHPIPFFRVLLQHREKAKLFGTYCQMKLDSDEKLRFSITIPGTVEARFSSKQTPWGTGCNIQNIPKNFRHIILPSSPDNIILNVDFKQADPHMVAWMAGETKMLEIMDSGGDLHSFTASAIVGYDITKKKGYDKDTSMERKLGKACNNGLNYGMGAERFMNMVFKDMNMVLTKDEAYKAIAAYFELYPGIKQWHRTTEANVYKTRMLHTPLGRTRYFYGPLTYQLVQAALAYVPPSTVADVLNIGWLAFLRKCKESGLLVTSLMQCHDSLTFEVHKEDLDAAAALLIQCTEGVKFEVNGIERHFDADISYGNNWRDLKSWKPN